MIFIDSCGTGDWFIGHPPHKDTQTILKKNNVSFEGQIARTLVADDFDRFDYIVPMDETNQRDLIAYAEKAARLDRDMPLILSYHPDTSITDVPRSLLHRKF